MASQHVRPEPQDGFQYSDQDMVEFQEYCAVLDQQDVFSPPLSHADVINMMFDETAPNRSILMYAETTVPNVPVELHSLGICVYVDVDIVITDEPTPTRLTGGFIAGWSMTRDEDKHMINDACLRDAIIRELSADEQTLVEQAHALL